jgi:hypothetical protein
MNQNDALHALLNQVPLSDVLGELVNFQNDVVDDNPELSKLLSEISRSFTDTDVLRIGAQIRGLLVGKAGEVATGFVEEWGSIQ